MTEYKHFRDAFRQVRKKTDEHRMYETGGDWGIQDSALIVDPSKRASGFEHPYDSEFDFRGMYPEEFTDLKTYLEARLASKPVIGIELGGRASRLFSQFTPGFIERSLGVLLSDNRSASHPQQAQDALRHHEVITADVFSTEGKQTINKWLNGQKADLIFERMEGAISDGPYTEPGFMTAVFTRWYRLLSERGIMLVQSPWLDATTLTDMETRLDTLKEQHIDVVYKRRPLGDKARLYTILEKKAGAPESF
ncbi:MAG: hypothetical protein WCV88_01430 [Patescibacteria group bacterium]|jgi:hypothetical protein